MTLPKTHTILPLQFRHTTIPHLASPQAGNNSFGGKKHKRKKNFRKAQKLNSSRLILKPKKKGKQEKKTR
jgi:hypothetical protein